MIIHVTYRPRGWPPRDAQWTGDITPTQEEIDAAGSIAGAVLVSWHLYAPIEVVATWRRTEVVQ